MKFLILSMTLYFYLSAVHGELKQTKTIRLDYNQTSMTSKVYTLKHVQTDNIAPFIDGTVKRSNSSSSAKAIGGDRNKLLLVNMPVAIVPTIDKLVKKLDKAPNNKTKKTGIKGTDISHFTYKPQYRSGETIAKALRQHFKEDGLVVYFNKNKNIIYGKGPAAIIKKINDNNSTIINKLDIITDSNDNDIITKVYILKHADPYEIKPILEAAVKTRRINNLPTGVECIKYNAGRSAVIISAERYRFTKPKYGTSIDDLVKKLDRPDITSNDADKVNIYYPKFIDAKSAKKFLNRLLFEGIRSPTEKIIVDPDTNTVIIKTAPFRQKTKSVAP